MEGVIEFQAFKDNENKFILKELAIVGDGINVHILFKSPYEQSVLNSKMSRTARWLTRHFHRIKWEDGNVTYNKDILHTLCKLFDTVYTRGTEKVNFLQQFHTNVRDISNKEMPDSTVDNGCFLPIHNTPGGGGKCAMRSAQLMYKFVSSSNFDH